jgi:hypothetical protein
VPHYLRLIREASFVKDLVSWPDTVYGQVVGCMTPFGHGRMGIFSGAVVTAVRIAGDVTG